MKFIKKNKFTILVVIFFILLVIAAVKVKELFFPNIGTGEAVYGERLNDKVKLDEGILSNIEALLKENKSTKEVSTRVSGRIINISITVYDAMSKNDAKKLGESSVTKLSEEQAGYYDVQVFITKSKDFTDFPIIGYKHYKNSNFSWTKDREGKK